MVALNFNARSVNPNVAFEPLPTGNYHVRIVESVEKPNSKGTGSYYEFKMQVLDGQFQGRFIYDRLNVRNPNQQAVDIAYSTLSAICWVTGVMELMDTRQLHGPDFLAVVKKVSRNDNPELMTNTVSGYKDRNGNDPGMAGTVATPQAQPDWATQQYTPTPAPAPAPAAPIPGQYTPANPQQQYVQPTVQPGPPVQPTQPAPQYTQAAPQVQQPAPYQPPANGPQVQQPAPAPAPVYPTVTGGPPPWVDTNIPGQNT